MARKKANKKTKVSKITLGRRLVVFFFFVTSPRRRNGDLDSHFIMLFYSRIERRASNLETQPFTLCFSRTSFDRIDIVLHH